MNYQPRHYIFPWVTSFTSQRLCPSIRWVRSWVSPPESAWRKSVAPGKDRIGRHSHSLVTNPTELFRRYVRAINRVTHITPCALRRVMTWNALRSSSYSYKTKSLRMTQMQELWRQYRTENKRKYLIVTVYKSLHSTPHKSFEKNVKTEVTRQKWRGKSRVAKSGIYPCITKRIWFIYY